MSANDPDGNVFDISQKNMEHREGAYAQNSGVPNPRHISHIAIRTLHPDEMARFYIDVFELHEQNGKPGDPNHYITDGKVTLMLMPWRIDNYVGQSCQQASTISASRSRTWTSSRKTWTTLLARTR